MPRRILLAALFAALLLPCAVPLALLADAARHAVEPPEPQWILLRGANATVGQILESDPPGTPGGTTRILRGDGVPGPAAALVLSESVIGARRAPDIWVVERDDGPTLFGRVLEASGPGWRVVSSDSVAHELSTLPDRLRDERERLVGEIRASPDAAGAASWARWLARDDSTLLRLDCGGGVLRNVRVSGVTAAWRSGDYGPATALRRFSRFLLAPPGAWGGGGIGPALVSVVLLALMAGLFSGLFGLGAALWISSRGPGESWLLRGRALVSNLAGVPGVVWGVAGAGLLVHGLGPLLDRVGGSVQWGGGGLLWSGITLGALASPIVMALALEELDRIPSSWKEIAWTCGATRLQIVQRVILPSAWKGLLAAVLSGMARAAGETAPLLLTGAVHAFGGLSLGGEGLLSRFAGGFLHPGVLALDSPWTGIDLERGEPLVALMLLLLSFLCIGLDLVASRLRHRELVDREDGP